tara:strand:- start:14433 stop:14930 length:498 start_codon:yes stop_codon:yes gene_type:complete
MNWQGASGDLIEFEEIIELVKVHSKNNGTVYIGTDSHIKREKCTFSTAICLIGTTNGVKNRYFISRNKTTSKNYPTLLHRITQEVNKSVDVGLNLLNYCPKIQIELHLDISAENKNEKTSQFSSMLVGYAQGSGFNCRIKPDAYAASSVADRHAKTIKKKKGEEK